MVFHDVSQQRSDERRLTQSEARKSAILDNALDCIVSIDKEGTIIEFNPAAERTFGHRASEVLGKPMADILVPPHYREAHRQGLARFLATGENRVLNKRFEITAMRFDGTEFPVELAITPIPGALEPTFTAHLRDITDRKQLEQELRQTAADLSEADRRKSEFLAILAHELRNPLAPVRNSLELIKLSSDEPAVLKHATRMMERQVAHMVRLIDDLLDVTRISRGKIELRPEPMDLGAVIEQTVESMRNGFQDRDQRLSVTLAGDPILLFADPTRISQVVGNLLSNACKFTPHGGSVMLTTAREGSVAVIRVRDTGIGIAPTQLPRIFTLFTQLDASLERTQGGLGIGLTLVKWLVELHSGTVDAHSDGSGQGAEFVVRLPVLESPATVASGRRLDLRTHTPHRILVVDDNYDAAESLAILLRSGGHTVLLAHDGEEAVRVAREHRPQVVLLDIGMPKLNGYEAARQIRQLPGMEHALLIALTGWGQEDDLRRSTEAGFNAHLVKPVDLGRLMHEIAGSDRNDAVQR
jgi:PAS domain S-box-containing protein